MTTTLGNHEIRGELFFIRHVHRDGVLDRLALSVSALGCCTRRHLDAPPPIAVTTDVVARACTWTRTHVRALTDLRVVLLPRDAAVLV